MSQASRERFLGCRAASTIVVVAVLCLLGAVQLVIPTPAGAVRGLTTALVSGFYGDADDAVRHQWFDTTVRANAGVVRIDLVWASLVGPQPPADPRNPGDPAYNFTPIDRAVRGAAERGLGVYFTIYQAPPWAEGPGRPAIADDALLGPGAWKPDPGALGDFATALATRYSGAFTDPATGQPLPRVRYYEAWNQPDIPQYLAQDCEGGEPTGVRHLQGTASCR